MIDPGALGTLLIGLDRVRREQEDLTPSGRRRMRTHERGGIGRTAASWLRSLADVIDAGPRSRDLATEI